MSGSALNQFAALKRGADATARDSITSPLSLKCSYLCLKTMDGLLVKNGTFSSIHRLNKGNEQCRIYCNSIFFVRSEDKGPEKAPVSQGL